MRALLFVNPLSRRGTETAGEVVGALRARGVEVDLASTTDNSAIPIPTNVDCLVSGGGDGTLARLIDPAIRSGLPVGVIPLGTFNELARTLHVPLEIAGACDVIAAGKTQAIDVARVNDTYYTNEASIGISSRITRLQTPEEKKRFGVFAIVGTALQAFRYMNPIRTTIEFDGEVHFAKVVQLTIANSHRFGGVIDIADAAIDDGWLDLYAIDANKWLSAFSAARALLSGKRESGPGLHTYRSTKFKIVTRHPHHIAADGEPAGKTPATFEILPKALRVFAPE